MDILFGQIQPMITKYKKSVPFCHLVTNIYVYKLTKLNYLLGNHSQLLVIGNTK